MLRLDPVLRDPVLRTRTPFCGPGPVLRTPFCGYNPEHSTPVAWVKGTMRIATEATNTLYLTDPRFAKLASYTAAAASLYHCPADKSTVTIQGSQYPRVRSFSMSQAVGTEAIPPLRAVDGIWLNGNHDHKASNPWRTYGKFADMVAPT